MSRAKPTQSSAVAEAPANERLGAVSVTAEAGGKLLQEVVEVVRACVECAKVIEQQQTERARIQHKASVQIELIQGRRELMVGFLDQAFIERRQNFRELFDRLDVALERDNVEGVRTVLGAIVALAKSSPFDALQDAASAHEALLDKSVVWEF